MIEANDAELLRISDDADHAENSRRADPTGRASVTVLAVTKTITTYPTAAGKFFACETRKILGTETEGSSGTGTNCGDTFYAYLPAGRTVPASGTEVVCERVAHRWILDY
jgi:hypothetical protein